MDKEIKIINAAHKKYAMPESKIYLPVHVGGAGKDDIGFVKDDTDDNISEKNPYFCELTGMYWAWKNLSFDYLGLVHYRRYFAGKEKFVVNGKTKKILSEAELEKLLATTDIILPKKRNYYIEALYSHYAHTMYVEPLDKTGEILEKKFPEYYPEFLKLKTRRSAHMFNMFIMSREKLNEYLSFLFPVLFELEKQVDSSAYSAFHARFYGRVSELLLDVWLRTKNYTFKEVKVRNIEKVNFCKKVIGFLRAKFGDKKYEKSF